MSSLVKIQTNHKSSIERARRNFKKSPKDRITKNYVETKLETLEGMWKDFVSTHRQILQNDNKDDQDVCNKYLDSSIYEDTDEEYTLYKSEMKDILVKLTVSQNYGEQKTSSSQNPYISVKLPKIEIPRFSGLYSEWVTFRDLFLSLIHKNTSLDNVQKMQYLKGHLTGEAELLLRQIPVTDLNYEASWKLLNDRYNNKRFLANCLIKRFMNQSIVTSESSCAIRDLLDATVDSLNGLKNLGIDINTWDVLIIYIVTSKLDSESRKQWEAKISADPSDVLPTFKQLKEFLEFRFRSLEFLDNNSSKSKHVATKQKSYHTMQSQDDHVKISCPFCKDNHKLVKCSQFQQESYESRQHFVQTNGLCFNCLSPTHSIRECRVPTTCRICHRKHHSLIHPITPVPNQEASTSEAVTESSTFPTITSHFSKESDSSKSQVLLATAVVPIPTTKGKQLIRALIDQGSQATFVTESAVQLLGLKKIPLRTVFSGLGGDKSTTSSKYIVKLNIESSYDPNFSITVQAYVLSSITSMLPSEKISQVNWVNLKDVVGSLADPEYHTPNKIDALFGAEVYGQIIKDGLKKGPPGSPIAQNTALGWILSGQTYSRPTSLISMHVQIDENMLIRKFWEIESDFSEKKIFTSEELECEEFYSRTTTRDATGRYCVRLPLREDDPKCKHGNSRNTAIKRLYGLESKFRKNPNIHSRYCAVIQEYLDLSHMEEVKCIDHKENEQAVYLPHKAVIREDKLSSPVRVVFDASCKYNNGVSLNDSLMIGPTIQPDLRHLILKWRTYPICLCADIEKMYRQVLVAKEDQDYQRLLWRESSKDEVKDFRLTRVTFGTASAPYLAVKTLHKLAEDEGKTYPLVAEKLKRDFYVDDMMSGCQTVEEGKKIYKEMKELLAKGGFNLQKWITNSKDLANEIQEREKSKQEKIDITMDNVVKILGISWDKETDCFKYSVLLSDDDTTITKRKVISQISKLFDPLGWAAPCVVTAKVMIQKLWLSGIDWDDELPSELLQEWLTYQEDLLQIKDYVVPRWIQMTAEDNIELHGFSDASNAAYGAAVYARIVKPNGQVKVNLIAAKTRVAPIMQISIPRLELMGAVTLAKLISEVAKVLCVDKKNVHGWTDSTIVLAWLSSHPSRWTTFVGNRVSEILSKMDNTQWAHVETSQNPADLASRGLKPIELISTDLWLKGPFWLSSEKIEYTRPKSISTTIEKRLAKVHVAACSVAPDESFWSKYSSLQKLIRVIAFCRRFLRLKNKIKSNEKFHTYLKSDEIEEALEVCIKHYQQEEFQEEIEHLNKTGTVNNKSKLKPLSPYIDEKGILRVGGRLKNANVHEDIKHPIILNSKNHFTHLLLHDAHKRTLHGGPSLMLSYLRNKYWIIAVKSIVKSYVKKCVTCARYAAKTHTPFMGQLPSSRVTPSKPFINTGMDFAGPIDMRVSKGRGNKSIEGYFCVFVCMVTKAIHLEAISDMTSEGFISGFKRFVARRGYCSQVWSDNGKNFVGAEKELKCLVAAENSSVSTEIQEWLGNNNVTWHFIPPHAPNFGGLWEAGVKSTKHHLKRVVGNSTLTYEEMATVLAQIEACLNSRPLTIISDDIGDPTPLTPGHFLIGKPTILIPERNYESSNIGSLKRWQMTQRMVQDFWRRWSSEYLSHCVQRYKWSKQIPEPKLGDIVLVKEDNLPPARWLMGKIIFKHPGEDSVTRVVTLKCNGSVIKRPTSKLCILPVNM